MLNALKWCVVVMVPVATLVPGACKIYEDGENDLLSEPSNDAALLHNKSCQSYGFRRWSLKRAEGVVTLSAEANMPTPAWSVDLHQVVSVGDGSIELIMETIEPSGYSSSVISWVQFAKIVNTENLGSNQADVIVKCADEVVWTESLP